VLLGSDRLLGKGRAEEKKRSKSYREGLHSTMGRQIQQGGGGKRTARSTARKGGRQIRWYREMGGVEDERRRPTGWASR
jgi:hypothetical protein